MCVNWVQTANYGMRPCYLCWQCHRDRVEDWVGRCIAESVTSGATRCVTLTYGRDDRIGCDHPHATALHYEDVQSWLKRLRWHTKGRVRFFCTGEFGSRKGRAHWHLILFFERSAPNLALDRRAVHGHWTDGWSFWQEATNSKMRHAVKYILKDQFEGRERVHRFSTVPGLGHEYFRLQAVKAVCQGLPPREFYRFADDIRRRDGTPRQYRLSRAALYAYLGHYDRAWRERYGNEDWPDSELMELYVDERERRARRSDGVTDVGWAEFERRRLLEKRPWIAGLDDAESVMLWPKPSALSGLR